MDKCSFSKRKKGISPEGKAVCAHERGGTLEKGEVAYALMVINWRR